MNIVLYGSEELLLKQRLEKFKKQYKINDQDMNLSIYYPDETSMDVILQDAITPPFLTEYKMVILRKPTFLTTEKQKNVSDEDIAAFNDYIAHDNPTTIFIIYHNGEKFDERKKVMKNLRKHAQFIELNQVDEHTIYKTVRQAIIHRQAVIDDDALDLLLERTRGSLNEASNQVEKLCLYSKHITLHDVERLVAPPLEENVFALTNAIMAHDLVRVSSIYRDLMIANHEPIALIGLIASSIRQLYQVKLLDRKGYTDKEIVKIIGINPRALFPVRKNARSFQLDELERKLYELSELDINIKTGKIDKQRGLELFLMQI